MVTLPSTARNAAKRRKVRMPIDIFQSRRNYNETCRWWSRIEEDENTSDELISKRVASGTFCAKEMSPMQLMNMNLDGVFRIDSTHTTIKSPDNLEGVKADDLVEYQGEMWRVDDIQKSKAKMQNTLYASDRNCSHFWYVSLRK